MVGREEAWPERRDVDAHECRTRQEREEKWKKKKKGEEEKEEEKEVLSFPLGSESVYTIPLYLCWYQNSTCSSSRSIFQVLPWEWFSCH